MAQVHESLAGAMTPSDTVAQRRMYKKQYKNSPQLQERFGSFEEFMDWNYERNAEAYMNLMDEMQRKQTEREIEERDKQAEKELEDQRKQAEKNTREIEQLEDEKNAVRKQIVDAEEAAYQKHLEGLEKALQNHIDKLALQIDRIRSSLADYGFTMDKPISEQLKPDGRAKLKEGLRNKISRSQAGENVEWTKWEKDALIYMERKRREGLKKQREIEKRKAQQESVRLEGVRSEAERAGINMKPVKGMDSISQREYLIASIAKQQREKMYEKLRSIDEKLNRLPKEVA